MASNIAVLITLAAQVLLAWAERRPVPLTRVAAVIALMWSIAVSGSSPGLWLLIGLILAVRLSFRPTRPAAAVMTLVACLVGVILGQHGAVGLVLAIAASVLTAIEVAAAARAFVRSYPAGLYTRT